MEGYKKIIQIFLFSALMHPICEETTSDDVWSDTAWTDIKKARANFPNSIYREIQVKIEKGN